MYQPQIAEWMDQKHVVAWSAVTYKPKGAAEATPGTIRLEADTFVALDDRLVRFGPIRIAETKFTSLGKEQLRDLVSGLEGLPEKDRVIALDRMIAKLDKSQIRPGAGEASGIKADPPPIFYSTAPAVFVVFDSQPVWSPISDTDLKFAVNTNWDVFQQPSTNMLFLRNEKSWLKAKDLFGPWSPAGKLPPAFDKLPNDANWADVRANLPGKSISEKSVPRVFVSYEPAELLLLDGEPDLRAVSGTSLFWVENTESDLFRLGKTGDFYFLVAGRWFSAATLSGPWTFATPNLPPDFMKIPLDHPRSRVLASVPGTDQAAEGVLLAQIPRTARVNKMQVMAPEVAYQGDPQFQSIEGTSLSRAVNTDKDIIKLGDLYYLCFQGVWFMSRQATGPWELATTIPAEIYKIPASSPSYNVTYVTIEQDDNSDDEWVTFAYVAAYTGIMVGWGCAVWGTGWYYPPYMYGGFYPGYYRPMTYGMGAWYNPWTGSYGRSAVAYGPYGGAGYAAAYNPRTGTYARGSSAWGPYNSRGFAEAYNPRTGTYARTNQGSNVYGNWGSSSVQRGDDWVRTGHAERYGQGSVSGIQTSAGGGAISGTGANGRTTVGRTAGGDVYAGHDGNVYRNQNGQWQQWDNGSWNSSEARPEPRTSNSSGSVQNRATTTDSRTLEQLSRDQSARTQGSQRTQDYGAYRSSGGSSRSSGSFRGGGGGGGRRR